MSPSFVWFPLGLPDSEEGPEEDLSGAGWLWITAGLKGRNKQHLPTFQSPLHQRLFQRVASHRRKQQFAHTQPETELLDHGGVL